MIKKLYIKQFQILNNFISLTILFASTRSSNAFGIYNIYCITFLTATIYPFFLFLAEQTTPYAP